MYIVHEGLFCQGGGTIGGCASLDSSKVFSITFHMYCILGITLGMHVQQRLWYLVCHSVRLSVTMFSTTTCDEAAEAAKR